MRASAPCSAKQSRPHLAPARQRLARPLRRQIRSSARYQSEMDRASARLDALVQDAIVWASQHGLVVGLGGAASPAALIHAPLSLLPVAFPGNRFQQAKDAMTAFNFLVDRVAADEAYLTITLSLAAKQDPFTGRLLQLLQQTAAARAAAAAAGVQEIVLGVHRSDYMLDAPSGGFLQVELNTIASSFGCLSTITTQLHHYILDRLAAAPVMLSSQILATPAADPTAAANATTTTTTTTSSSSSSSPSTATEQQQISSTDLLFRNRLPPNTAMQGIAKAMAAATQAAGGPGATMVMVVQPGERNAYDQQWLQQTLWAEHRIITHRLTLSQIVDQLVLQPIDQQSPQQQRRQQWSTAGADSGDASYGRLVFAATGVPVGLVYFRAGYTPNDYPTETEWQARERIECSTACKCPSVAYQLAGSKKIQQDLARPGVIERFMGDEDGHTLQQLFAGLWSLDDPKDPSTAAVIQDAVHNPDRYVLKPQREGGGNNLYGQDLVQTLQQGLSQGTGEGLAAYILMQRIQPPPQRSVFVRNGEWSEDDSLSELGIYGTFLKVGHKVITNEEVGHLVRTKTSSSNEGGVAAGFAVLDSPLLTEPGEGLLPVQLEQAAADKLAATMMQQQPFVGAHGGVLAMAKAILASQ